ncbi:MAG: phage tail protein [Verrucomicrobiota bacterium]
MCDGAFESDEEPAKVIETLAGSMAGRVFESGGQWVIHAGVWRTPELDLTEADLLSGLNLSTRSERDLGNGAKGTFLSKDENWSPVDFEPVSDDQALLEDANRRGWIDQEFRFTTEEDIARRLASINLKTLRSADNQISAEFTMRSMQLRPGDIVTFTYPRFGWISKTFEVQTWRWIPPQDNKGFKVAMTLAGINETDFDEI